ncbi:MAG: 4-alpha-glucanotransferase [Candidatus Nanopelagicales bacterium]
MSGSTAKSPSFDKPDDELATLADAFGVSISYQDQAEETKLVSAPTIRAVLQAMGVDASTQASCRAALAEISVARWESALPPSVVVRQAAGKSSPWQTWVHVRNDDDVRLWIDLEGGGRRHDVALSKDKPRKGSVDGVVVTEIVVLLPRDLPLGYHRLVASTGDRQQGCELIVTPERLTMDPTLVEHRGWGVAAQLYSARSSRSWGIGDLADLGELSSWLGRELGSAFTLVNPLHSAAPIPPMEASPYLPITRRFANPIYLRVEAIPEFAYLGEAARREIDELAAPLVAVDNDAGLLDRDAAWAGKRRALELVFGVELGPGRQAGFDAYVREEGQGLTYFATWCALAEEHGHRWDRWPAELQELDSAAVTHEAQRLSERVAFHRWLQWQLDEQMAAVQHGAKDAGMPIGIMHDLAVGVHRFGSDTWSDPLGMARGVTVGAPPDNFNQVGQNWSQPPGRPDQLAATGYRSYRDMLRTLLRHSGGLRIDHVLGLFRLWWIPEGMPASAGTYVQYDHHAMVDILVLEAHRAGALVVGEDLGTVQPWVRGFLAERGILGTTILWFERKKGVPIPPAKWRANAMATVTVHDLPPTLGFLAGAHVTLRHELNLLSRPLDDEQAAFEGELHAWRTMMEDTGLLRPRASDDEVVVALHRLMTWSPAKLLAVTLTDLVGDRRIQNQPGTDKEYPNWKMPLCGPDGEVVLIDDLPYSDRLRAIVGAVGGHRRGPV